MDVDSLARDIDPKAPQPDTHRAVSRSLHLNPFFQEFGPELTSVIAEETTLELVPDGDCLIEIGEAGGDLFVVEAGRAVVEVPVEGTPQQVAEACRGAILGELSVIRGTLHGARVIADRDLAVWRIPRDTFRMVIETDRHWSIALLHFLAERLQKTTTNLAFLSFAADKVTREEFTPDLLSHIRAEPAGVGLFAGTFEAMARYVTERAQRLEAEVAERTRALSAEIRRREQAEQDLRQLAATDPLTGASNRRHFFDEGARELQRAQRSGHPVALLQLDIDHFKRVNDSYGHAAGDCVLKDLVACCRGHLRSPDLLGRLGGEEFAVLVPECPPEAAERLAERLRESLAAIRVTAERGEIAFTVSIGVALCDPTAPLDTALEAADRALYAAKQQGRNRVVAAWAGPQVQFFGPSRQDP